MGEEMLFLDIEKVDPPGDAVRDLIDPEQVRELAESIRSQGLLQPILVRPFNGRYEVVAGHRRYLAHRLIGEVKIKALVREMGDEEVFVIRAMENDQREDLNPIEKAKVYKRLKDKFGWSAGQISQKMGRSKPAVLRYLELLEIPEEFQSVVSKKKLSMGVALCLNQIDDELSKKYYFTAAVENGVTLEVAEAWVNDYRKTRAGTVTDDTGGMGGIGPIQESLPIYQTCVCCVGPVEVNKVHYVPVCPECEREIRGALKPK
jgi:ParB family chromosome partitioning protein